MTLQSKFPLTAQDILILKELQKDGRRSFTDIARVVNVAIATVRKRVNQMIENGVLQIMARVNPYKVGFNAYANIFIKVQPPDLVNAVAARIAEFPEISWIAMTTGDYDLTVDVMCRDNDHLTHLITERLSAIEGVAATRTEMVLKVYKVWQADFDLLLEDNASQPATADRRRL